MKAVEIIIIILVGLAGITKLFAIIVDSHDFPFLAFAGIIAIVWGGYKIIKLILKS